MPPALTLHPIGYLRTPKQVKFDTDHQPVEDRPECNILEFEPHADYALAVRDLAGFSRVWLVSWFHRNTAWRPLVLPPRGPKKRRGVFATRSPHRPNPIGLTAVELIAVEPGRLLLGPCDLLDGTPVLDLKPYIPAYDAFPEARGGWTTEVDAALAAPPPYTVAFSPLAAAQAEWLATHQGIDFRPRMQALLSRDPTVHRTRRIRRRYDGRMEIGCGAWRAFFTIDALRVEITSLAAAYPGRWLDDPARTGLPDREAQIAFRTRWPESVEPPKPDDAPVEPGIED